MISLRVIAILLLATLFSENFEDCQSSQSLSFSFVQLNGDLKPLEIRNFPESLEEDAINFCVKHKIVNADCAETLLLQAKKVSRMHNDYSSSVEVNARLSIDELQLMERLAIAFKPGDGHYKLFNNDHTESYSSEKMGGLQFNLLYLAGIDEKSRVLEIGCGSMGLANLLIPYLSRSHYTCIEPLKWVVETSLRYGLGTEVLHTKYPVFLHRNNFTTLNKFEYPSPLQDDSIIDKSNGNHDDKIVNKFDYIVAHSIFSHTNERMLEFALTRLFEQMQEETLLVATFVIKEKSGVAGVVDKSDPGIDGNGWIFPNFVEYEDRDIVELSKKVGLFFERIDSMHPFQNWYIFGKTAKFLKYISRKINDKGLHIDSWVAVNQGRFIDKIAFEKEDGFKSEIEFDMISDDESVLLRAATICSTIANYFKVGVGSREKCMMHYGHEIALKLVKQGFIQEKHDTLPTLAPDIFSSHTMWRNMELNRISNAIFASYHKIDPFPHAYFDATKLLGRNNLRGAAAEFARAKADMDASPDWGWSLSKLTNSETQFKKASLALEPLMGPFCQSIFAYLKSSIFVKFLESVTKIPDLIADPLFHGSGLHQTYPGGFLSIHTDFNKLESYSLWRRVNIFLYLNEDWDPNWRGGALELWNDTHMVKEFAPIFGRMVIFTVSKTSFHGHPWPLEAPIPRKSLALYYYSNKAPESEEGDQFRSTVFPKRYPNPNYNTDYYSRSDKKEEKREFEIRP